MNTHENRALFSKAVLKATICLFLAAGASVSQAFAFSEVTETMRTEIVQQTGTITGKIIDSNGEAIIGASVVVKGTSNGTITDIDGNFTLTVPVKAILTVSYVGYETVYVPVDGKKHSV